MLERETSQRRDLDRQTLVLRVEAVDQGRDHDGEFGFLAEFFLGLDDGEIDLAMGCIVGEGVDF